ncbi:MAG: flagellar hook-length control protein FliK, partial [Campylobacterota bacterium]|nr:flagellar hook-length control protein FliK [Campylobacterota bacterium]
MTTLDIKGKKASPFSLLSIKTKDTQTTLFAELLKSAGDNQESKSIQNGAMILALQDNEKDIKIEKNKPALKNKDAFLELNTKELDEDIQSLNPELSKLFGNKEMKEVVAEAKSYLKEQILNSDAYKKSQIKELPNTLEGLVKAAKSLGIDVTKISLEEVMVSGALKTEEIEQKKDSMQDFFSTKKEIQKEQSLEPERVAFRENKVTREANEAPVEEKNTTLELKDLLQEKTLKTKEKKESLYDEAQTPKTTNSDVLDISKVQKNQSGVPLFMREKEVEYTTTEQIVQVKISSAPKAEQKSQKERADDVLKLLLQGEKALQSSNISNLTPDFSVASAKVVPASVSSDGLKTLEHLLNGESLKDEKSTDDKTEAIGVQKLDNIEVKINEAKQMIRYLSSDIKSAIDDYKSPFTRVKVQLNPQNLGEVDLTL